LEKIMALCEVRTRGEITIVVIPPMIDHVAAMTLEKELREFVSRQPKALLCDCSGTKYISSSALRVFLLIAKMAKTANVHFGVFSLTQFVDHIFTVSGFASLFSIYDNEDAAVRAVSRL
jgi:anti-sigma B factor antagonist